MKSNPPFWRSKTRLAVFALGIGFLIFPLINLLFDRIVVTFWKEAPVIESIAGETCGDRSNDSGRITVYSYEVDGRSYTLKKCAFFSTKTITYFPPNPSIAVIRNPMNPEVLSLIMLIPATLLMLGAIFLRDPRPGDRFYTPT